MAAAWADVQANPEFQKMPYADKVEAQKAYFNEVVAPKVEKPSDLVGASKEFFSLTPKPSDTSPKEDWDAYYKATVRPEANIGYEFSQHLKQSTAQLTTGVGEMFSGDETKGLEGQYPPEQLQSVRDQRSLELQDKVKRNTQPIEPAKPGSLASYAGAIGGMIPSVGLAAAVPVGGFTGALVQGGITGAARAMGTGGDPLAGGAKDALLYGVFHGAGSVGAAGAEVGASAVNKAAGKTIIADQVAKRAGSAAGAATVGGATGGVEGAVLGAGIGAVNPSEPMKIPKTAAMMSDAELSQAITQTVKGGISKGVKPTVIGKRTGSQSDAFDQRAENAVKDIVANKESNVFTDEKGVQKGNVIPENLKDFSDATQQGLDRTFKQYDDQCQLAGEQGISVSGKRVGSILKSIVNDPVLKAENPVLHNWATQQLEGLRLRDNAFSPSEAQDKIKEWNDDLKSSYQSGSFGVKTVRETMKHMVETMRSDLDSAIESGQAEGSPNYQSLKNQYGAYKALNKEVQHRFIVDQRKAPRGIFDLADTVSSGELVYGGIKVATGNPEGFLDIGKGIAINMAKRGINIQNDPNIIVKDMFSNVDKLMAERGRRANVEGEPVDRQIPINKGSATNAIIGTVQEALPGTQNPEGLIEHTRPDQLTGPAGRPGLPNLPAEKTGFKDPRAGSIRMGNSGETDSPIALTRGNLPALEDGFTRSADAGEGVKPGEEFKSESQKRRESEHQAGMDEIRRGINRPTGDESMSFDPKKALKDILTSMRGKAGGSVNSPEAIKASEEADARIMKEHLPALIRDASRVGKPIEQYLKDKGMPPGAVARLTSQSSGNDPDILRAKYGSILDKANSDRKMKFEYLDPNERRAQKFILDNPKEAMDAYISRSRKEFGGSERVVSADIGKFAIPGMASEMSGHYHEAGSALAKVRYEQLLSDTKTKDLPVVFTAGGSGSGKSFILKQTSGKEGAPLDNKYAAIVDGNMNNYGSAVGKINAALESVRDVGILYVYRDPIQAFSAKSGSVIQRINTQDRTVKIAEHRNTHEGAQKVVPQIAEYYKNDPRVEVKAVDNSFGKGSEKELQGIDKVPTYDYTSIEGKLYGELKTALNEGRINGKQFKATIEGSPELIQRAKEEKIDSIDGITGGVQEVGQGTQGKGNSASGLINARPLAQSQIKS